MVHGPALQSAGLSFFPFNNFNRAVGTVNPIRDRDQKSECTGAIFTFEPSWIESLANPGASMYGHYYLAVTVVFYARLVMLSNKSTGKASVLHAIESREPSTPELWKIKTSTVASLIA